MAKKRIKAENLSKRLFTNDTQSKIYIKNDCGSDFQGSSVNYIVLKGKYYSHDSKEEANQKAIEDLELNGQQYANDNGTCTQVRFNAFAATKDTFTPVAATVTENYIKINNKVPKALENKNFKLIVDIILGTKYIAENLVIDGTQSNQVFPFLNPENKSLRIDIQKFIYDDEKLTGEYYISRTSPIDEIERVEELFSTSSQSILWSINKGDVEIDVQYNVHSQPTIEFLGTWRDIDGVDLQIKSPTVLPGFIQKYPKGTLIKQWQNKGYLISPDIREIGNKIDDIEIILTPFKKDLKKVNFTKLTSNIGDCSHDSKKGIIKISRLELGTDVKIEFDITV